MLLIITLALVHFSSDLERGSEMQLVSYFLRTFCSLGFGIICWNFLLSRKGFLRYLKLYI